MNYNLRNANIKDIQILIKYKLNTIMEYANDLTKEENKKIINYVNNNIPKQINNYQMILINNKIIGAVSINNIDDGILLDEIFIEKDFRNKGIGSNIIKKIIENYDTVYLWVYKLNYKAINLYKKMGFKIVQETETRYYMKTNKTNINWYPGHMSKKTHP